MGVRPPGWVRELGEEDSKAGASPSPSAPHSHCLLCHFTISKGPRERTSNTWLFPFPTPRLIQEHIGALETTMKVTFNSPRSPLYPAP